MRTNLKREEYGSRTTYVTEERGLASLKGDRIKP